MTLCIEWSVPEEILRVLDSKFIYTHSSLHIHCIFTEHSLLPERGGALDFSLTTALQWGSQWSATCADYHECNLADLPRTTNTFGALSARFYLLPQRAKFGPTCVFPRSREPSVPLSPLFRLFSQHSSQIPPHFHKLSHTSASVVGKRKPFLWRCTSVWLKCKESSRFWQKHSF